MKNKSLVVFALIAILAISVSQTFAGVVYHNYGETAVTVTVRDQIYCTIGHTQSESTTITYTGPDTTYTETWETNYDVSESEVTFEVPPGEELVLADGSVEYNYSESYDETEDSWTYSRNEVYTYHNYDFVSD